MIDAPNSQNLDYKVRFMKGATGTSLSAAITDIFRDYM